MRYARQMGLILMGWGMLWLVGGLGGCTLFPSAKAVIQISTAQGTVPLTIRYDAAQSIAPDEIVSYRWAFNGADVAYSIAGEFTFHHAGMYTVELTIRTASGKVATDHVTVEVGPAFWVADEMLNEIYKLDGSGSVLQTLASPVARPRGLAVAFRGGSWLLYVVCEGDGFPRTLVLNPSTGEEIARFTAPAQDPGGLAYAPVSPIRLWHVDRLARKIFEINPSDGMFLNAFGSTYFQTAHNLGAETFLQTPQGIAWRDGVRDAGSLWVLEAETRKVYELEIVDAVNIFDGTQLAIQADPIVLPVELFPISGIDWHDGFLWVVDRNRHRVVQIDPQTGMPTGVALTGFPGAAVSGLAIQR